MLVQGDANDLARPVFLILYFQIPMQAKHETIIHARCPYAPVWDYYTVIVKTPEFLACEHLQLVCDEVRGKELTQEQVFEHLRSRIDRPAIISIEGCHGQNGKLLVTG